MSSDKKPATFSYAAAAATNRATLAPQPASGPASRRKSAPESSLKIPLVDRSEVEDPTSSKQEALAIGRNSRSPSPIPQKVWTNSRLPHKKSGEHLTAAALASTTSNTAVPLTPPTIAIVAAAEENSWKAVGSPPRRLSASVPQTPAHETASEQTMDAEESDDLVLMRKRGIRTRAASTPNPLVNIGSMPPTEEALKEEAAGDNNGLTENSPSQGSNQKWGGLGWGPSIWKDNSSSAAPSLVSKAPTYLGPESLAPGGSQQGRQFRSYSFSLADGGQEQDQADGSTIKGAPPFSRLPQQEPLRGGDDEDDYSEYTLPKARSRSKSSSAIYGLIGGQDNYPSGGDSSAGAGGRRDSAGYSELNSIWSHSHGERQGHEPSLLHRRASTQPNYGPVWENLRGGDGSSIRDEGNSDSHLTPGGPSPERVERYRQQRRFSHAPNLYNEFSQQLLSRTGAETEFQYDSRRRHSLAGPLGPSRFLDQQMDGLYLDDPNDPHLFEEIDDYFENTEHRTRAWVEAGKNLQMQSYPHPWPLYVVEFKAGRIDFFYFSDTSQIIKVGDLVMVEADRGKDLGKVINDSIGNNAQLQLFQNQHGDAMLDSHYLNKEIHPKRIFRLAQQNEIPMLVSKSQDEAKAMAVCQTKIRQKKLPMEVVDAEYQWDRRKLTFYFVADRRIDFRELVRDLFKLYKTRIWMCAVNPAKLVR
ncbi:hypothetical protein HDU67_000711 [Dinochytrium kinnereticum]|nr:hypothetical protein HDU67_000711 [Dinochytrium kinnereticum]